MSDVKLMDGEPLVTGDGAGVASCQVSTVLSIHRLLIGHYLYYLLLIGQGWRTERENYNRAEYGDSAPRPQNDQWKRDDES